MIYNLVPETMAYFAGKTHRVRTRIAVSIADFPVVPLSRPQHEEIARLAYAYWEARGRHTGTALDDWLRAERELMRQSGYNFQDASSVDQ